MNPNVQRFTGFADIYDQYRPELPLVISEVLSQLAGPERPLRVVDVGSGTGLSTAACSVSRRRSSATALNMATRGVWLVWLKARVPSPHF